MRYLLDKMYSHFTASFRIIVPLPSRLIMSYIEQYGGPYNTLKTQTATEYVYPSRIMVKLLS